MGKLTISMAIFNSYFDITRGYIPYQNGINGHLLGVNVPPFGPRLLQVKPLGIIGWSLQVARKGTLSNWSHRSCKSSVQLLKKISEKNPNWAQYDWKMNIQNLFWPHAMRLLTHPILLCEDHEECHIFLARLSRRIEFALPHWQEKNTVSLHLLRHNHRSRSPINMPIHQLDQTYGMPSKHDYPVF